MTATYVTAAELKTTLGIGTLYDSTDAVETVCQTAQDLLNQYLWFNSYPVVGVAIYNNVGYAVLSVQVGFTTGQTITLTNCGSTYNGSHTITATWPWTNGSGSFPFFPFFPWSQYTFPRGYELVQFNLTAANDNYHLIVPYGTAAGIDTKDTSYAVTPAIREAALMIAVDIWQARQQSSIGGVSPDFSPSPYRMGNTLMARVRGLIAPYTSPRSMVG
jgi:hypothetical protein